MSSRMRNGHPACCVTVGCNFSSPFRTWCDVTFVRHPSKWQVSGAWLRVHHKAVYPVRQHTHRASAAKKAALTTLSLSPLTHRLHAFLFHNMPILAWYREGWYRGTLKTCRITELWANFTKLGPLRYSVPFPHLIVQPTELKSKMKPQCLWYCFQRSLWTEATAERLVKPLGK